MIQASFEFAGDNITVEVSETNVIFHHINSGMIAPIEGLKLSKEGIIKEFPELKGDEDWRQKAIQKFKEHIKKLPTEMQRIKYIIEDLKKHGYKPLYLRRKGFRPQKI